MSIAIPITKGLSALVDDDDADWIGAYRWHATSCGPRHIYAARRGERRFYMHREIMQPGPGLVVDHVNGDTLDNRRCNLRVVSHAENIRMHHVGVRSATGYYGVSRHRDGWTAGMRRPDGGSRYIGKFKTAEEAARARDAVVRTVLGELAILNFPEAG